MAVNGAEPVLANGAGNDVHRWFARLEASGRIVDKYVGIWNECDRFFCGNQWNESLDYSGAAQVDVPQAYADWRLIHNASCGRNPKINCKPTQRNDRNSEIARIHEAVANDDYRSGHCSETRSEVHQNYWKCGFGISWFGYDCEMGYVDELPDLPDGAEDLLAEGGIVLCDSCGFVDESPPEMAAMGAIPPCPTCGKPMRVAELADFTRPVDTHPFIRKLRPWTISVDPDYIRWEPSQKYPWKANWVARCYIKPLEAVQAMKAHGWKNTEKLKGEQALTLIQRIEKSRDTTTQTQTSDNFGKGVMIWEIWNKKASRVGNESEWEVIILADELHDEPLYYSSDPWRLDVTLPNGQKQARRYPLPGPPVVFMHGVPITRRNDMVSDLRVTRPEYGELTYARTMLASMAHAQVPGLIVQQDSATAEQLTVFTQPIPGKVCFVSNPDGIKPKPIPNLDITDWGNNTARTERNIDSFNGISSYKRSYRSPGSTATEAQLMEGGSDLNLETHVRAVEAYDAEVIRTRMAIITHFWTEPSRWLEVTGENLKPEWMEVKAEDIAHEVIYDVEMNSTRPGGDNVLVRLLTDMYQVSANDPNVNRTEFLRAAVEEADLSNPNRFFLTQPKEGEPEWELYQMFAGLPVPPTQFGNLARHIEIEKKAMEVLNAMPPQLQQRAQIIAQLIGQHIQGEQAFMSGGVNQGAVVPAQASLDRPGVPAEQTLRADVQNLGQGSLPR